MALRKRWMLQPMSWRRGGLAALLVLTVVAAAALVLDAEAGGEYAPIVEQLAAGREPLDLITELGRASTILILSDVRSRAGPKRLATETIERLVEGPGLDAVVLAVPASEQRYIDAFLAGGGGASLMARPAAVKEAQGMPREYMQIYEAVRAANEGLNPSRRVRVIAADVEGWPPTGAAPRELGEAYARRAEHMLTQMDRQLLSIMPDARVLVFVDGYLALQGTHGELDFGGGEPVRVEWLGTLLRRRSGTEAVSVLLDVGSQLTTGQRVPAYHGTVLHRPLRRELDRPVGARIQDELAEVREPVRGLSTPGLELRVLPRGYTFGEVAQGYIFLPSGR